MQFAHGTHAFSAIVRVKFRLYLPSIATWHHRNSRTRKDEDMAAFDTTRTTYGSGNLFGRVAAVFGAVVSTVVDWNDARMTRNALNKLTDRELADIGMTRSDIDVVAEGRSAY